MKPTAAYKMSTQTKRILATMTDKHKAGEFKRFAIQCELAGAQAKYLSTRLDKQNKE